MHLRDLNLVMDYSIYQLSGVKTFASTRNNKASTSIAHAGILCHPNLPPGLLDGSGAQHSTDMEFCERFMPAQDYLVYLSMARASEAVWWPNPLQMPIVQRQGHQRPAQSEDNSQLGQGSGRLSPGGHELLLCRNYDAWSKGPRLLPAGSLEYPWLGGRLRQEAMSQDRQF